MAKKLIIKKKIKSPKSKETSQEKTMRMAQDLTGLIYHPGWSVLKEINENNIEFLDAQIIKKMDPDGKPLTETQCDELRIKRDYLEELINTPMKFVEKLKQDGQIPENFDPYFSSVGEMKEVANKREH